MPGAINKHKGIVFLAAIISLSVFFFSHVSIGGEGECRESIKEGIRLFGKKDYAGAIDALRRSTERPSIIGDYALLYLSKAYIEVGENEAACKAVESLRSQYPETPLVRQASAISIRVAASGDWDNAIELLSQYVGEYPSDEEMRFLLAGLLGRRGRTEESQALYRGLYLESGEFSGKSYGELAGKVFSSGELLYRAENLIARKDFASAEKDLKLALEKDDGAIGGYIAGRLGLSLFRQKKYREAARAYLKADNLYGAAKSFLRADEMEEFKRTLDALVARGDEAAVDLLVAGAVEKQNKGLKEESLRQLEETISLFPSNSEKAMWQTAWTYYRTGDYTRAAEVLGALCDSIGSGRYRYWRARAVEKAGDDAAHIYREIEDGGYYSFLARSRLGSARPASAARDPRTVKSGARKAGALDIARIDALVDVGLQNDAVSELVSMSSGIRSREALIQVAFKLMEIGAYSRAMAVISNVPEGMRPDDIQYPLAYGPVVWDASERYGLDPYLVLSLMREESRFDQRALSTAGAIGLMQLMPATARRAAEMTGLPLDGVESIYDVENNIRLGVHYLNELVAEFGSVVAALAAYNAGEGRVRQWLEEGGYESYDEFVEDMPYEETRNYVKRIITTFSRYRGYDYPLRPEKLSIL